MPRKALDVSVVLTFADDEDLVGRACRRIAEHLRGRGLAFELLAVDVDSGDNSHAVLALLRKNLPELRVLTAAAPSRGFAVGAAEAQGRVLWMTEARAAVGPLAPFGRAYRRVDRGETDLAIVPGRFCVAYRTRLGEHLEATRGRGEGLEKRLARRVRAAGLTVEVHGASTAASSGRMPGERPWGRIIEALTSARAPWTGLR